MSAVPEPLVVAVPEPMMVEDIHDADPPVSTGDAKYVNDVSGAIPHDEPSYDVSESSEDSDFVEAEPAAGNDKTKALIAVGIIVGVVVLLGLIAAAVGIAIYCVRNAGSSTSNHTNGALCGNEEGANGSGKAGQAGSILYRLGDLLAYWDSYYVTGEDKWSVGFSHFPSSYPGTIGACFALNYPFYMKGCAEAETEVSEQCFATKPETGPEDTFEEKEKRAMMFRHGMGNSSYVDAIKKLASLAHRNELLADCIYAKSVMNWNSTTHFSRAEQAKIRAGVREVRQTRQKGESLSKVLPRGDSTIMTFHVRSGDVINRPAAANRLEVETFLREPVPYNYDNEICDAQRMWQMWRFFVLPRSKWQTVKFPPSSSTKKLDMVLISSPHHDSKHASSEPSLRYLEEVENILTESYTKNSPSPGPVTVQRHYDTTPTYPDLREQAKRADEDVIQSSLLSDYVVIGGGGFGKLIIGPAARVFGMQDGTSLQKLTVVESDTKFPSGDFPEWCVHEMGTKC